MTITESENKKISRFVFSRKPFMFHFLLMVLATPLFFLSSAFFPISESLPTWLKTIAFLNPLFYMVDGMRGSFTGTNNIFSPVVDLLIIFAICLFMMGLGSYFFSKSEV